MCDLALCVCFSSKLRVVDIQGFVSRKWQLSRSGSQVFILTRFLAIVISSLYTVKQNQACLICFSSK